MREAVSKIVADVRATYRDASPDIALDLINTIHRELCSEFPIYTSTIVVPLVSGQSEYEMTEDICWIRDARYVESENSWHPLTPGSCEELDASSPGWRWSSLPSVPSTIYIDSGNIGLHPAPSVSSVAGPQIYPRVDIVAAVHEPLAHDGYLPYGIRTRAPWVNGARMLYAQMYDKPSAEAYTVLYERSVAMLQRMLGRRARYHRRVPRPARSAAVRQI